MEDDGDRWDARYGDRGLATPTPPDALIGRADVLALIPTSGRALDVASGAGAQTLWLADCGLDVVALDVSTVAVRLVEGAAEHSGLADRIDARVHDLDAGLPDDCVGLDVIVCQRFRDPRLYPTFVERLAVGGLGVVTVLSEVGLDGEPGEFHARAGELLAAFDRDDVELLAEHEGDGHATVVFRRAR